MVNVIAEDLRFKVHGKTRFQLTITDYENIAKEILRYFQKYTLNCNQNIGGKKIVKEFVDEFIYPVVRNKLYEDLFDDLRDGQYLLHERIKVLESQMKLLIEQAK